MFAIPDATTGHTHLLHPPVYLLRVLASYNVVFSLALRGFIKMKMQWGKKKAQLFHLNLSKNWVAWII